MSSTRRHRSGRRNVFGKGADNLTIALTCLFVPAPLVAVTVTSALGSWHHGPDVIPFTLPRKKNSSLFTWKDTVGVVDDLELLLLRPAFVVLTRTKRSDVTHQYRRPGRTVVCIGRLPMSAFDLP